VADPKPRPDQKTSLMAIIEVQDLAKTHLLRVYAKLGVSDRAAAVATAFSRGYLGQESS